jgi:hypothetical protein
MDGDPWDGEDAAVGAGSVVAWQRGDVFLGMRLGLAGPARPEQRLEITKPGTLRWQGEGAAAELELLVYGRKQAYGLLPPLDDVVVSVLTWVAARGGAVPTLEAFSRQLATPRLVQTTTASVEKIAPVEDPETAFLNENKPKEKAQYHFIGHLQFDSRLGPKDKPLMHQQVDLGASRVLLTEIAGAPLTVTGPWASPLLNLTWDQAADRQTLAVH